MAAIFEQPNFKITGLVAGADLSAKQYYAVKINSTSNEVILSGAADINGVLRNSPLSGENAEVINSGIAPIIYGGTITAGDSVEIDSDSKAIAYSSGAIVGTALSSGVAGDIMGVLLK